MTDKKRTLIDHLRDLEELLGRMLSPQGSQPAPRPVPVRSNERQLPKRR